MIRQKDDELESQFFFLLIQEEIVEQECRSLQCATDSCLFSTQNKRKTEASRVFSRKARALKLLVHI